MDEDNWRAMALIGFAMSNQVLASLYRAGKVTKDEAREIYEQALLNLETNQTHAGTDQSPVIIARQMLELALKEFAS